MRMTLKPFLTVALLCLLLAVTPLTAGAMSSTSTPTPIAVSAGGRIAAVLWSDGTVTSTERPDKWHKITEGGPVVAIETGDYHVVCLYADGTALAEGDNDSGQCNVSRWTDLVSISASKNHTLGLRSDGTVVAVGANYYGQCEVSDWRDIVAIASGDDLSLGIRRDGTVAFAGDDIARRFEDVPTWRDVRAVSSGSSHIAALLGNGRVVECARNYGNDIDVSSWTNVSRLCSGDFHIVGLRTDGTVVATGNNHHGQCEVSDWKNIVDIAAGESFTIGLTAAGEILVAGDNILGALDADSLTLIHNTVITQRMTILEVVCGWSEICDVELFYPINYEAGTDESPGVIGVKKDGSLVCCGVLGPECDISSWSGLKSVSAGSNTVLGLREDGSVVATGDNLSGQCDVSEWRNVVDILSGYCCSIGITEEGDFLFAGSSQYDPIFLQKYDGVEGVGLWTEIREVVDGYGTLAAVRKDGSVIFQDYGYGFLTLLGITDRSLYTGVRSIALSRLNVVELLADGGVCVLGDNRYGQNSTSGWTGIIQVASGRGHTVGLRSDGRVLAVGNNDCGQCDVSGWRNIVKIVAGDYFTMGVTEDGRVLYTGIDS